jgi:glutamate-ammonia-ligase adenylyltransferase
MRERMWRELSSSDEGTFDIKRDPGGVGDIEFIVQYLVLANAHRHRSLLHYTDNIRQLGVLATCGILGADVARRLQDVYRAYRRRLHHLALDNQEATVPAAEFADEAADVRHIWQQTFG